MVAHDGVVGCVGVFCRHMQLLVSSSGLGFRVRLKKVVVVCSGRSREW